MIKISELQMFRDRAKEYGLEIHNADDFIRFVSAEQENQRKGGVVSLESRLQHQRLKSMVEQQEKNKLVNPEEDYQNL